MKETHETFPEHNQNFWQLASIQASASGIPVIIVGSQIASLFGTTIGICSVILGNLILWIIGMSIISMSAEGRNNALENIRHYLGKIGSISSAIFLILAFLSWYILQINSANVAMSSLLSLKTSSLRLGAGMGALIALLSIGGIKLIRKYCTFIFPFLVLFCIYSIFAYWGGFKSNPVGKFSFVGIFTVMSTNLAGMVNLPTFFRHSRSQGDSYLGLSLMTIFTVFFQIYAIIVGFNDPEKISSNNAVYTYVLIGFILLSLISINLVNIYFASAGWELIFPHRKSNKEFAIIGLLGTLAYTFFQITAPMEFLLDMADNFIASLGIILLLSFLTKTFEEHRPGLYEKTVYFSCWFFGAIVATFYSARNVDSASPLMISFYATTLAFLLIVYIEETFLSAKKIILERHE